MPKRRRKVASRRRAKGRGPAEYFLAAMGIAVLVFLAAMLFNVGSCRVRLSDEIGLSPRPTPHPTPDELQP